ncbi:chloride channel protein [Alicyclobacillus cycloheptanicus]|uniref:CIC family chloride channel protein n=1 Tax=Alicyclobacillus cycloheptanicus TaxID=1457 RepID=A0ABT9XFB9_9BACL|nr:chloride channel protein [Alicyclobacillus cycloheptanicus]MDQ0188995.1 CIC family chloride channel protein [Alicyclobacillus cycloheptanicus]WDM01662.1 chloride channel protein [Alicyclobacillus cycloheptanicus]
MNSSTAANAQAHTVTAGRSPNRRHWFTPRSGLHTWLTHLLPESLVLLLYAVLIGVVGGLGAVVFRKLINFLTSVFFTQGTNWLHFLGRADVVILPAVGLVAVSCLVKYFAPEAKGHGVPEVMAAIAENGSIIRGRVVVVKTIASALTIGSGGSVGREGPIVQIGSAFGSLFGQYLGLPERYLRLMVACGAGAGIAATFNAPVGGVMFATEVILGSFALQNFTAIVISSVVSAAIGRVFFGDQQAFPIPMYQMGHFGVYWVYVILGLLTGLWSYVYIRTLYRVEDWFDARKWPFWGKALAAGLVVGVVGMWFPQVFGVGYPTVDLALQNHMALWLMCVLLVLKLLMTSVTIAGGGSGGVFSPGLYMGSMLGGAVGIVLYRLMPHAGISPGAMAAIAMAGVFAGSAQAPVTAIMMLFEMTGDYSIILPLMITAVLATTVTSSLSKESIYTMKLVRRGLDIARRRQPDRMRAVYVGEAVAAERMSLPAEMAVKQAWERFSKSQEWFAWVRDAQGRLIGSVARAQVLEALTDGRSQQLVKDLLPKVIHRVDERATLAEALDQMNRHDVTYLLVCRGDTAVGVIGSSDIVHAYKNNDLA